MLILISINQEVIIPMKKNLLLLAINLILVQAFSQTPTKRVCGTLQHHDYLLQTRPNYQNDLADYNQVINRYLQDKANGILAARTSSNPIVTIPVVVHILYNTPSENITDAQAASQVQVLNDDFAKFNADASKVTQPTFSTVASGANIRFCLAQRDPNGNATTGIVHKATSSTSFSVDDKVKHSSTGGDDAWDVTRYVNIWVCDLGPFILGYGEFPTATISNTWGLVLHYKYTGSGGSAVSPFNLGRTGTHEFGHCFNLLHIWGDDNGACSGSDQCSDTPNQANSSSGSFPQGSIQTDNCSPSSPGIMWMNYMDYSDDGSLYMFTAQQCARMEAVVNTAPWNVLQSSNACMPPMVALDAAISNIAQPGNGISTCTTSITPQVTLLNAGSTTLTSAQILYKMDATATQTLSWSGSLATNASTVLTLNNYSGLTLAAHTFSVWTNAPNNSTDLNTTNDSKVSSFTVGTAPVITVNSVSVCTGSSATLTASGASTYTWNTGSNTTSIAVSPSTTTTYTVTGDLPGCSAQGSKTATVTINPLPTVNMNVATSTVCININSVNLTGTPSGGTFSGTGVSGNSFKPSVSGAGTFTITYSYTNSNGCSNTASKAITVELCTGLEEMNGGEWMVYPNPAKETVTVKFAVIPESSASIELYDAIGKLVISRKVTEQSVTLDVQNMANGIYTLRIVSGEDHAVKRLVKE